MKHFAAIFAFFLFSSCSERQRKIEDFAGDWETPPMSELFEIGISEQIEDLRDGTHPDEQDFDKPEMQEFLSLSTEEAKAKFMESGIFGMTSQLFAQADPKIGFTISPPSRLVAYISINGERQAVEYEAEYELTSKEIICRYEDGPTILTISGNELIADNEKEGYPTKFRLHRAANESNNRQRQEDP